MPPALGAGVQVRRRAREEQAHLRFRQAEGPQLFSVARIKRVLDTPVTQNRYVAILVAARIYTRSVGAHTELLPYVYSLKTLTVLPGAILVACVEINQCVGCTAMTRPSWLVRAVGNRQPHAVE